MCRWCMSYQASRESRRLAACPLLTEKKAMHVYSCPQSRYRQRSSKSQCLLHSDKSAGMVRFSESLGRSRQCSKWLRPGNNRNPTVELEKGVRISVKT
eukprot:m.231517 g.231517  ORF g.231517 m.231517 type:complete len:98 (+) comp40073_c0_seq2:641-934(+)